ncbi:MAG: PKD domain-containing protein [Cyclobacteriaceae bacterium]|jgi:PKD repeat protein/glycosyltransferase involved in cell wall biosynthesis|nr:PKD domain-containing protein [Cyclobacteriaceae bacterium]
MRKPVILVIENSQGLTGALKSILRTAEDLRAHFEFVFVMPRPAEGTRHVYAHGFSRVHTLPMRELSRRPMDLLAYWPVLIINAYRLRKIVRQEKADIIHVNDLYNLLPVMLRLTGSRIPYVCHIRFLPAKFPRWLFRFWLGLHNRYAFRMVAVSHSVVNQLPASHAIDVIYNELPAREQLAQITSRPENPSFLYLANYTEGKGQHFALRAFAQVHDQLPGWRLTFVGGDLGQAKNRDYLVRLQRMAERAGIASKVTWRGFTKDVETEYKQSQIILNFSESESFSIVCLEALFFARPLIATDCGGPGEIVKHMETGILVPNKDVPAMANAMVTLALDESLQQRLATDGKKDVTERFSLENTSLRLKKVYDQALTHARVFVTALFVLVGVASLLAQPTVSFSAAAEGCLGERIPLTNTSVNATGFEWDFCQGDLERNPNAAQFFNLSSAGGNVIVGMDFAFENGRWYGFYCNLLGNSIFRLDFGADLNNSAPTVTNLGNPGGLLNGPQAVRLVFDGTRHFAFISNRVGSKLIRLELGTSVAGPASGITASGILAGDAIGNGGVDVAHDGARWVVGLTNAFNITLVNFGSDLASLPGASNVLESGNIVGASTVGDLSFVSSGNQWYGFAVSVANGRLYRLHFGATLFSIPTAERITSTALEGFSAAGVWAVKENNEFKTFVGTDQGSLFRMNFGADIENDVVTTDNLGSQGVLSSNLKIRGVRDKSRYFIFTSNWQSNDLYRISFPQSCGSTLDHTAGQAPAPVVYNTAGTYAISLFARPTGTGQPIETTHILTIDPLSAPSLDFVNLTRCTSTPVDFVLSSNQPLVSFDWSFGDGNVSALANPSHSYAAAGSYPVSLRVEAANGCRNFAASAISIYDPPTPSFTAPSGLVCTGGETTFVNTTPDVFDGNLVYEWSVDGSAVASTRDLSLVFATTGTKTVQLVTSLPGCSNSNSQSIGPVQTGPTTDFSFAGICEDNQTVFTNGTTGSVTSYTWNFGDGNASTSASPTHVYTTPGTYQATLSASSANGCVNSKTAAVVIRTVPQTNFSLDLPPFSCSGSPAQFRDATPPPADSNISSWVWAFGDASAGTGTGSLPTYTYAQAGDYTVRLTTTTNVGCVGFFEKMISILPSPTVDFTVTPACVGQNTVFTESGPSTTTAWQWIIASSSYTVRQPTHRFSTPGNFTAQLRATAPNQCIGTRTKAVVVPVLPALDFSVTNNCVNREARFEEANPGGTDPAAAWTWTFGDGGTGTGSPSLHAFAATGSYPVRMDVTRQSGCIYSLTKSIVVGPGPTASFVATPTIGPPPLNVAFTNTSSNATSYVWQFNDAVNSTTTQPSPLFTFSETGVYPVELTARDNNGCQSVSTQMIFAVVAAPDAFAVAAQLTPGSQPSTQRLSITVTNRGNIPLVNPVVVLHVAGGSKIQETIVATLAPDATAIYTLATELLPGTQYLCAELAVPNDVDVANNQACINLEPASIFLLPYPNPATDDVVLEMIASAEGRVQIECFGTQGQRLWGEEVPAQAGFNQWRVSVASLPAGIYFLRVHDLRQSVTHRLVVHR